MVICRYCRFLCYYLTGATPRKDGNTKITINQIFALKKLEFVYYNYMLYSGQKDIYYREVVLDMTRFSRKFYWAAILVFVLVVPFVSKISAAEADPNSEPNDVDKPKVAKAVADQWLAVAVKQYQKGLYRQAEESLLQACEYKQYLPDAERRKIEDLLGKTRAAAAERALVSDAILSADDLIGKGRIDEAKMQLEQIRSRASLTDSERKLIAEELRRADSPTAKVKAVVQPEDTARKAVPVPDADSSGQFEGSAVPAAKTDRSVSVSPDSRKSSDDDRRYFESVVQKRNIARGYIKAVIEDVFGKAEKYIEQQDIDKARASLDTARRAVDENELLLGTSLYEQYDSQLQQLAEKIGVFSQTEDQR